MIAIEIVGWLSWEKTKNKSAIVNERAALSKTLA